MPSSVKGKTSDLDLLRPPQEIRQIVVPVDLTSDSNASIDYAIHLAKRFGSTINLLHLYQEPYVLDEGFRSRSCDLFKQQRQKVFADFYSLLSKTRHKFSDSIGCFEYGNPDREIDVIARQLHADLLIVSIHEGRWLEHFLFGRHIDRILAHAPCPILIVPEEKRNYVRWKKPHFPSCNTHSGSHQMSTPLVPSASPLSEKLDNLERMEDAGASTAVLHSLFEEHDFTRTPKAPPKTSKRII